MDELYIHTFLTKNVCISDKFSLKVFHEMSDIIISPVFNRTWDKKC